MYIFAHVLAGVLLGLVFRNLTRDWRALPLCIFGAILPDLIDKPLALLVPVLSSGRTIFHSLIVAVIVLAIALAILRYRHSLLGLAVAAGIFSHQFLDSMWQTPQDWLFLVGSALILTAYLGLQPGIWSGKAGRWIRSGGCVIFAAAGFFMLAAGLAGMGDTFLAPEYSAITTVMAGLLALGASVALVKAPGTISDNRATDPDPENETK
jgi:LexA-binding, inner membrane-associated putative hydrolase